MTPCFYREGRSCTHSDIYQDKAKLGCEHPDQCCALCMEQTCQKGACERVAA